jgi:hypothetical protein
LKRNAAALAATAVYFFRAFFFSTPFSLLVASYF